jgi:hypothetical protein
MSKPIVSNLRRSTIRAFCLGIITGSFLTAGMVLLAGPARADTDRLVVAYASVFGGAVCSTLDQYPSSSGIIGIGKSIVEDGLTGYQAGQVIALSVMDICPRHTGLMDDFAAATA